MSETIIEKVQRLMMEYAHYHYIRPNAVYVGYKERTEILATNESIRNFQMPDKDKEQIFGIDMIEVSRENYLAVGYVESSK